MTDTLDLDAPRCSGGEAVSGGELEARIWADLNEAWAWLEASDEILKEALVESEKLRLRRLRRFLDCEPLRAALSPAEEEG